MSRLGGMAVACGLCVGSLLAISQARAARSPNLPTARVAALFAAIIRQDARQAGRRSKASVTVVKRCCGVRVLRVHYRAKPTGHVKRGAYVLRLEARRGIVQGVAIFESATEVRKPWSTAWHSGFVIHHESHGPSGGWSFGVFYDDISTTVEAMAGPRTGLGSSWECRLPAPVPAALYQDVLGIMASAKRHDPARLRRLPRC
jgi:hypothetical protein